MPRALATLLFSLLLSLAGCSTLNKDPTADWTAEDFYEEASEAIEAGEFQTAISHLETLEARFPFDPYAKQAQLDIAYAYYKFDEPESALSAVDRFIRLHPRDTNIDYALYLKGLVNFYRGKGLLDVWFERDPARHDGDVLQDSYNDFAALVRRFPDSRYAGDAHQRMIYLRNKLAQKEIEIAEFYLERNIWLSASNRAKQVLLRYQESIWSHRALEILVIAYTELGLDDLAADADRVLALNKGQRQDAAPSEDPDDEPPSLAQAE